MDNTVKQKINLSELILSKSENKAQEQVEIIPKSENNPVIGVNQNENGKGEVAEKMKNSSSDENPEMP